MDQIKYIFAIFLLPIIIFPAYGNYYEPIESVRNELCNKLPSAQKCSKQKAYISIKKPAYIIDNRSGVQISLKNGKRKVFSNSGFSNPAYVEHVYSYLGVIIKDKFVIIKGLHYAEEKDYYLVALSNGETTKISGYPIISPDGRHIVTIAKKYDSGSESGDIYRIEDNQVIHVHSIKIDNCKDGVGKCFWSVPLWKSPGELIIFKKIYKKRRKPPVIKDIAVHVKRDKNDWITISE